MSTETDSTTYPELSWTNARSFEDEYGGRGSDRDFGCTWEYGPHGDNYLRLTLRAPDITDMDTPGVLYLHDRVQDAYSVLSDGHLTEAALLAEVTPVLELASGSWSRRPSLEVLLDRLSQR